MRDIFWGVTIIAIGLYFGQSIFLGDFSALSLVFDGLGLFWLGKGALSLYRKRHGQAGPGESPGSAV
jgi:hypothetical protein